MDFESGLRAQVAAMPNGFKKRRWNHLLGLPPDNHRRQSALLRLEQGAREHLGVDDETEVNWTPGATFTSAANGVSGTIDWNSILQALLPIIISIIKALFGI